MKVWSRWRLGASRHTLGKRLLQLMTDTVLIQGRKEGTGARARDSIQAGVTQAAAGHLSQKGAQGSR